VPVAISFDAQALLIVGFGWRPEVSLWVPVVAALGASLLTSLGAWGLEASRQRAAARSAASQARRSAYVTFVEAANGMLMLGPTLRALLQTQSGLAFTLAGLLRLRPPVDPFQLAWRMADDVRPLLDAQAGVLSCGTPRAAIASKDVATATADYLQAATAMTAGQCGWMGVVPWRPTSHQEAELASRLERAGQAVQAFVIIMREDLGELALPIGAPEVPVPS